MRYYFSSIAITVIGILIFTACQTNAPASETAKTNSVQTAGTNTAKTPPTDSTPMQEDPLAKVPRIALADAKKAFDEGNVVFIDTRAEVQYREQHVKGAINIPTEAFQTRFKEVPKGKKVIAYCS
jgi:3-mercaptopyruvate sulfurtransferase SseA